MSETGRRREAGMVRDIALEIIVRVSVYILDRRVEQHHIQVCRRVCTGSVDAETVQNENNNPYTFDKANRHRENEADANQRTSLARTMPNALSDLLPYLKGLRGWRGDLRWDKRESRTLVGLVVSKRGDCRSP